MEEDEQESSLIPVRPNPLRLRPSAESVFSISRELAQLLTLNREKKQTWGRIERKFTNYAAEFNLMRPGETVVDLGTSSDIAQMLGIRMF